jgi:hypothetical protein
MHWLSIFQFLLLSTFANATNPKTTLRFETQLDVDMIDIGVQQADEPVVGDAPPSATMIDNRKRYSFDSKTNDEIKAADFQHWRWTRSGRDGTYIVQPKDTSKIQLQHIKDLEFSRVLAQEGDIQKATGSNFTTFSVSEDLENILLSTDHESGWRHSYFANYFVYNVADKVGVSLNQTLGDKTILGELGSGKISLAVWAPTGNIVAWVRDNDLYVTVVGDETIREKRITRDGSKDMINVILLLIFREFATGCMKKRFSEVTSRCCFLLTLLILLT